jgi:hypothetical protein
MSRGRIMPADLRQARRAAVPDSQFIPMQAIMPDIRQLKAPADAVFRRRHQLNEKILDFYIEGSPTTFNVANQASVRNILIATSKASNLTGLTPDERFNLQSGIVISDLGKRMDLVTERGSFYHEAVLPFFSITSPAKLPEVLWTNPYLDGVTKWLQRYQAATGQPLAFSAQAMSGMTKGQQAWAQAGFAMEGDVGELTPANLAKGLGLVKVVWDEGVSFYPMGLLHHEIPGAALAEALGLPEAAIRANDFHNGPVGAMEAGRLGVVATYQDVTDPAINMPFWLKLTNMMWDSPYPMPMTGEKLGIIHTMLDRVEQGRLKRDEAGDLVGGPRKILSERLMWPDMTIPAAVLDVSRMPAEAEGQIHHLWYHRVTGTSLEYSLLNLYERVVDQLSQGRHIFDQVDFGAQEDPWAISFKDGQKISVDQDFTPTPNGKQRLTDEAGGEFVERFYAHLAQYGEGLD